VIRAPTLTVCWNQHSGFSLKLSEYRVEVEVHAEAEVRVFWHSTVHYGVRDQP